MSADLEQHFILRVPNPELANKLRGWLRDQASIEGQISLVFEASELLTVRHAAVLVGTLQRVKWRDSV